MKQYLFVALFHVLFSGAAAAENTYEFEVHGLTCAFCVDALRRNLEALPDVERAEISLKHHRVRLHPAGDDLDIERLRRTVVDAGFTPVGLEADDAER